MRITRSNPVLAALATVLSLWSLTVLIESPGWLVGTIGYLVVIGVVGAGLRRLGWTGLAVLATQTVAVALSAIWLGLVRSSLDPPDAPDAPDGADAAVPEPSAAVAS